MDTTTSPSTPETPAALRYFLSYTGVTLPLSLVEELEPAGLRNRNTYYRAAYDAQGHMLWLEQLVYDEVALRHDYQWTPEGKLAQATITMPDEDPVCMQF